MYLLKIARTKLKAAHWSYDATNWMSVLSMGFCLLFYSSLLFACNWIYFWPFVCYFRAQFHKGQKSVKQNPVCGSVESGNGPCTEKKTKTKNIETHIESTCRCWIWDISIETITELQPLNNIIRSMPSHLTTHTVPFACVMFSCRTKMLSVRKRMSNAKMLIRMSSEI